MRSLQVGVAVSLVMFSFALVVACGSESSNEAAPDGGATSSSSTSSGGSTSSSSGGSTPSAACGASAGGINLATYADRFCKVFTPCCPRYGYQIDDAKCRSGMSLAANDLVYDPVKAEECATAREAAAKATDFCRVTPTPPVCADVWKRCSTAGPAGTACKDRYDCLVSAEGPVDCEKEQALAPGFCRLEARAKLGDACDGDAVRVGDSPSRASSVPDTATRVSVCYLSDGLYCDSTRRCTARHATGETCTLDKSCTDGLICWAADGGSRCEPIHTVGQPCVETRACASGLYCVDATKKCEQRKSAGASCVEYDACISVCENGSCVDKPVANIVYAFNCGAK